VNTALRVRPPAVAGTFYPGDSAELAAAVDRTLPALPVGSPPGADAEPAPKALIVPHAGYVYSGSIAGTAYARLAPLRDVIHRVVLLGPAHRVPVSGLAVSGAGAFATPLGVVEVDDEARRLVLTLPQVRVDDAAHAREHSLEVHLPFLQRVLARFRILPLLVGHAVPDAVSDVLDLVWGGPETLIVVSSDLSHYHDYTTATVRDGRTAQAIVERALEKIEPEDACGVYPVKGLLEAARRHGLTVRLLDLRNSGDTAGPRDEVVGYGAFALA
jgi:AmmeMemoRadiSam system protein B